MASANANFFLREPVLVASKISAALLVFGAQPHPKPTAVQRATLTSIVKLMRKELGKQQQQLADPHSDVTITGTLADIRNEVDASPEPRALLDANLTILAASKSLCTLLAARPQEHGRQAPCGNSGARLGGDWLALCACAGNAPVAA